MDNSSSRFSPDGAFGRRDLDRARFEALAAAALALAAGGLALADAPGALTVLAGVASALAAAVCAWEITGARAGVQRTIDTLDALAMGDFSRRVIGVDVGLVGRLMLSANAFADIADAFVRESRASLQAVTLRRYHRRIVARGLRGDFLSTAKAINEATAGMAAKVETLREATGRFSASTGEVVGSVASASHALVEAAGVTAASARAVSEDAVAVAAAAEEASANVQTVAAAAEELSASIAEIGRQVSTSRDLAKAAVERATATDGDVRRLSESAARIGDIVDLIQTIAGQTNLLALNATIEAARAGEAGKGFAVVASEVKNLANQTAKATGDITRQVLAIQEAAAAAVDAIRGIAGAIEEVNANMVAVAGAVEQQDVATREIAANVEQASAGTAEVSTRIAEVTRSAGRTGEVSRGVHGAASELSSQSDRLRGDVEGFLGEVAKVA